MWVWYVAHGAGFIQDGLLGQVEHQLCPLGFLDSELVTNAVFLLAFAKSPGGWWGVERLEAQLALSFGLGPVAGQFAALRVGWKIHGELREHILQGLCME